MNRPDIDLLERLASEVPRGSFWQGPYYKGDIHCAGYGAVAFAVCGPSMIPQNCTNAKYVTAALNASPDLIAYVRHLEAIVEQREETLRANGVGFQQ